MTPFWHKWKMQNARLFLAHYEYINSPHITYYKHLLKGSCYKEKAMLLLYSIPPSVVSLERHFIFQLNINSYRYSRSSLSRGICSRIPGDAKIREYSSPLYKMAWYLHINHTHPPITLSCLDYLWYLIQCKSHANSCKCNVNLYLNNVNVMWILASTQQVQVFLFGTF